MWDANKVKEFVKRYIRIDGKPAVLLDWQLKRLIEPFYNIGNRPYHRISLWCPKKSGKSFITALLAVVHCCEHKKPFVLVCASTVKQAEIIRNFIFDILDGHSSFK